MIACCQIRRACSISPFVNATSALARSLPAFKVSLLEEVDAA